MCTTIGPYRKYGTKLDVTIPPLPTVPGLPNALPSARRIDATMRPSGANTLAAFAKYCSMPVRGVRQHGMRQNEIEFDAQLTGIKIIPAEESGLLCRNHSFGWAGEEGVETARERVAKLIGATPKEIIFTSGATESDNLAIKGVAEMYREKGNHIITAVTEHKAVLDTCKRLEKYGYRVTYMPVQKDGLVDLDDLKRAMDDKTILVTIMYANNEIGVLQPVAEIGKLCRERGVIFHTDATQAVGKVPVDVEKSGVERLVGAEQARNSGIAERKTCGGGSDEERAAAQIRRLGLGNFHVRIHVALRSVPAFEAVRISEAARMIAFWMRE